MSIINPQLKIGELLLEQGVVTADQLEIALTEQKKSNAPVGKIIVGLGFVSEAVMRDFLGKSYRQESVDLAKAVFDHEAVKLVPKALAHRHKLLPVSLDKNTHTLLVAMVDPFNVVAIDSLTMTLGSKIKIRPLLATELDIINAIDSAYGFDLSLDGILHEIETGEIDYQSVAGNENQYNQPLIRLVDALLTDAVKRGASDIHFEPENNFLRVRYRLDGVLEQVRSLHKNYWSAIAVRLKVMATMNIAENRIPQDGRISMNLSGRSIDFRVSSQPTMYGENIVLRILDREKGIVSLEGLKLRDEDLHLLRILMARPEGIILITGPTGSGKTTTLYSLLNHLNTEDVNIMTLEDPVEYHMAMVRQTPVNEAVGLDFANGIRSMLRQDPDIVLIGEIRDEETAEMAFRAAMTGHQVYTTLHTNSAIGALTRLRDLNVLPDIMAENIIGIIGQRLIRKLCSDCREAYAPSQAERVLLGLSGTEQKTVIYRAKGCARCRQRGYKGRFALMEILRIDDSLEELIARKADTHTIKQKAITETGFRTLADDGIRRVLDGGTSLAEVSRVINLTNRMH
ncbi:MAG: Flp pilus assembly complex ATPase component [Gammaproteobacteria bacterium]|nr:Flp pilus assembly complex ATPase component [Gammaproteobacteria bacterium]